MYANKRMESNGEQFKIHMSASTAQLLHTFSLFLVKERGELEIKGKGEMVTYWLCGEFDTKEEKIARRTTWGEVVLVLTSL